MKPFPAIFAAVVMAGAASAHASASLSVRVVTHGQTAPAKDVLLSLERTDAPAPVAHSLAAVPNGQPVALSDGVAADQTWRVRARVQGWWSEEIVARTAEEPLVLTLQLYPLATLAGVAATTRSAGVPESLSVTLRGTNPESPAEV